MRDITFVRLMVVILFLTLFVLVFEFFYPPFPTNEKNYIPIYGDTIVVIDDNDSIAYYVEIIDSVEVKDAVEWGPTEFKLWNE